MEQTRAILLRSLKWSETSLIITWLSENHGVLRTMARGARKPASAFAGRLDLFFQAEISFVPNRKGGDLHELREASVVSPFDASRAGGAGLYMAAYFAELAGHCAPAMQPAVEMFDLLTRGLRFLQTKPATEAALHHYEREMARILGVHDSRGVVGASEGLASLGGGILKSRTAALRFFRSSP
jgi:DNA repair protein RecO (recombination protein O)